MSWGRLATLAILSVAAATGTGCSTFMDAVLPPHANSLDTEGEKVTVNFRSYDQLDATLRGAYKESFGEDPQKPVQAVVPKTIPVLGLAIDVAKSALDAEADRYEYQFHGQAEDRFKVETLPLAIELQRATTLHNDETPSSRLVLGLQWAKDGLAVNIRPILVQYRSTGAKVLHFTLLNWIPPLVLARFLKDFGDSIDLHVEVQAAVAVEDKSSTGNGSYDRKKISIEGPSGTTITATTDENMKATIVALNWNGQSAFADGVKMTVKVLVKEQDSLNAKKYILKLENKLDSVQTR